MRVFFIRQEKALSNRGRYPAPFNHGGEMYYVYLLKSKSNGQAYVGSTKDLKKRFQEHNTGNNKSTKSGRPWEVFYYEAYAKEKFALSREKRLKQYGKSLGILKKRIGFDD